MWCNYVNLASAIVVSSKKHFSMINIGYSLPHPPSHYFSWPEFLRWKRFSPSRMQKVIYFFSLRKKMECDGSKYLKK